MKGFTLLETSLACFLLGCILLAAAGLFPGSALALRRSACQNDASSVAECALESARAQGFTNLTVGNETLDPRRLQGIEYACLREVLVDPATPVSVLKRVRVTVTWKYQRTDGRLVRESWLSALKT